VNGMEPTTHPSKAATHVPSSSVILMGIKEDLLKFTLSPVDLAKTSSISLNAMSWLSIAGRTMSVSSAYHLVGIGKVRIFLEHISFTTD